MPRKSDHDRRSHDSGGNYTGRTFNVAVVGLSGTEKDKGCLGVGKSCLCNRFVRPQADEYNKDHISVLSQPDFSGPIVNNEHWLYWGETRKCTEEGFELTFSIIEQTEFVDDACFQPFRSGKTIEAYYKRCAATRLSSAEKLMYICKNQLGVEKEYEQHYLPDSRFTVDGFLCVFDVSEIQGRSIERQIEMTTMILNSLMKTKKPIVLVTTKNDEMYDPYVREAEKLVSRKEYKGLISLVETSAHENVNVDLAFWACVQRDWTKGRTKLISFNDAYQKQRDRLEVVNDAYMTLIQSRITDYRTHWNNTYSNLSQTQDFLIYCDLFGQDRAQQTFKRHVKKLKDDYVCRKMQMYLRSLPKVLIQMLPDLESFGPDQSWLAVQHILQNHPLFDDKFVINESILWQEVDDTNETRIPFDLLSTPEAEKVFVDHLNSLLADEHLRNLRYQFNELLRETPILPGQPLKEIRDLLSGRECVQSLPESELKHIYDEYQRMLQDRAREQLVELFLERAPLFLQYCIGKVFNTNDLTPISNELMDDERWIAFDLLPQDRTLALYRHLGFIHWPIKEHCQLTPSCIEMNIEAYCTSIAKRSTRHPLWNSEPEAIKIKLIVLGSSGYADNLATVVKAMCPSLKQENPRINYDIQTITGNEGIDILASRLYLNPLESEAYLCVYSSRSSLEYVLKSLEQSLLTDLQYGNPHHASAASIGLPLVLLLANNPDTPPKERSFLREEGANRAQSLQCAFFDVTSNEPHARFKSDELLRALLFLTDSLVRRSDMLHVYNPAASSLSAIPEGALHPEIRILLSLMCGDPIQLSHFLELLLLPNSLPNTMFYPVSKHSFVTDVGFLVAMDDESEHIDINVNHVPSRYVEFVVTSYHGSYGYKEELIHGHILVYWSKRQASFSNMSAFASTIMPMMPIQILSLVENDIRPSKLSHQLVAKGQELADSLNAIFRVSTMIPDLGRCISSFLNYALQNKHHIEKALQITSAETQPQHSPGSVLSNEECYDPNVDEHFESILPSHSVHSAHQHLVQNQDQGETLSDTIYEPLPDDQHKIASHSEALKGTVFQEYPPLVRHQVHQKYTPRYSPETLQSENGPGDSNFFTPIYDSNNPVVSTEEEHLVKPSQIKHRRRFDNYYNLQSYPSADSLDRVYSMEATQFYSNITQMPPHYIHRPFVHQRSFVNNSFFDSPSDNPPPRPASSAHVMIPSHHNQPPPYSRVAVSPPPEYKVQSSYEYEHRQSIPFYPNNLANEEFELASSSHLSRKYYPQYPPPRQFRSYSPPLDPYTMSNETSSQFSSTGQSLIRHPDVYPTLANYRNSPLIYATSSRNHHARSSHFHQLVNPPIRPQFLLERQRDLEDEVSPYAVGRSYTHRHHKKKKKRHSKSQLMSKTAISQEVEDDEYEEDEDDPTLNIGHSTAGDEKVKTKKLLTKLRRRRNELSRKIKDKNIPGEEENSDKKTDVLDKERIDNQTIDPDNKTLDDDSDLSRENINEPEETNDEDDETVSSNLSAEEQLNATADRYAVSSGWAYHQNEHTTEMTPKQLGKHHFADQWPPPQPTDEESSLNERYKAPGRLDLKRFNHLSNAIERLNLNSPGTPLGPTRVTGRTSLDDNMINNNKNKDNALLANTLGQQSRRSRLKTKQFSASKEVDSNESDYSDNNLVDKMSVNISDKKNRFNSLNASVSGSGQKKLQKKPRVVPVPVAPPRLPSSATNSTAVTPTSGTGKLFISSSSFDDSQQDKLKSDSSDITNATNVTAQSTSTTLDFSTMETSKDLDWGQLGDYRKSRRPQISKLFSLQTDNESGAFFDDANNSMSEGNFNSVSNNFNIPNNISGKDNDDGSGTDKAKFLKSKSVGTFSEIENKKLIRKAEKLEKKRQKEEERKSRKASKEANTNRNRSRSKVTSHSNLEAFAQSNGSPVPLFIEKCTQFIEQEGLDMEGIYRVPGNRAHVDTLLLKFDENPEINIGELDIPVNAVATALKDFFMKRLPPIFPPDSMTDIADLSKQYTDNGILCKMRTFLQNLPNANYHIIHFMVSHFVKVVEKSGVNSMDSKNLAICWWPTLLQFEFSDMFVFEQMRPHLMNFVQIMIDSYPELFSKNPNNSEDNLTNLSHSADELSSL